MEYVRAYRSLFTARRVCFSISLYEGRHFNEGRTDDSRQAVLANVRDFTLSVMILGEPSYLPVYHLTSVQFALNVTFVLYFLRLRYY